MAMKVNLTPKEAAALFLAASAGVHHGGLTDRQKANAQNGLERLRRSIEGNQVKLEWADEEPPFMRRRKDETT